MIYCFDLDGTITTCAGFNVSDKKIPTWIIWLALFFYKPKINQKITNIIYQAKKSGGVVIIVTRRSKETKKITTKFLRNRNIPYDKIFFVGNKKINSLEIKRDLVIKINPDIYFDNNKRIIEELIKNGINAILV